MNPQLPLSIVPASRSTDSMGSVDAEEWINRSGKRAQDQRICLKAFVLHPGATTSEVAALEGLDRYMVARRTPELAPVYLTRIEAPPGAPKGQRELRWNPTESGKRFAAKMEEA